jgi:hypothetical protein
VVKGEILEECIWSTFAGYTLLIPTCGSQYQNALRNTGRMNKRVSLRRVRPGNHIVTVDGVAGIYLGTYYPISKGWMSHMADVNPTKRAVIAEFEDNVVKTLHLVSALKVSEVTNTAEKPKDVALAELNTYIKSDTIEGLLFPSVVGFTASKELRSQNDAHLKPVTYDDAASGEDCILVVECDDGTFGLCHSFQLNSPAPDVLIRSYIEAPIGRKMLSGYNHKASRMLKADPDIKQYNNRGRVRNRHSLLIHVTVRSCKGPFLLNMPCHA